MLTKYQNKIKKLKAKRKNENAIIVRKLAEVIISYSAHLPELLSDSIVDIYPCSYKRCNLCTKISSCYAIKYNKQFDSFHDSLILCFDGCHHDICVELDSVNCEFIYKKMLTSELSEIGDINTHIFGLFLELYREIEI
jgi:TPP-dependent indolepyruvate ferredoxin oxidoreductase alpha subunit